MARGLLAPDMFGVTAIAYVIMSGLAMFSDLGLRPVIIRSSRAQDPVFLNTAWTLQIFRGVLLWIISAGIALLLFFAQHAGMVPENSVYADPRLSQVVAVLSFAVVIDGFTSTKVFEAARNLVLHRIALLDFGTQTVGLLSMLGWVAIDRSIWALVAGAMCATLTKVILSHIWLHGHRNRWQWEKSALLEIVHFGKWILLASLLGFLAANSDRLLLGAMVDSTVLGVYVIAFLVYSSVEQVLAKLIADVTLPALSEVVREKPKELTASYYRLHAVIGSLAYFCSGLLLVSGQTLISLVYDGRYLEAGWMLQILAIALMTVPFGVAARCFVALGMPKYVSRFAAIRFAALVLGTFIGFRLFGLHGAVWGITLSYFSFLPMTIFFQARHGILDFRRELYALGFVPVGAAVGWLFNAMVAQFAK